MSGAGSAGGSLTLSKNKIMAFLQAQFLPIGLLLAVVVGNGVLRADDICSHSSPLSTWLPTFFAVYPAAGVALSKVHATKYAASGIFLIGGLKLRTEEAKEALRDVKSVVFGVISILFLTGSALRPSASFASPAVPTCRTRSPADLRPPSSANACPVVVGAKLARMIPLSVPDFTIGLTLFMCMPCTISSGAGLPYVPSFPCSRFLRAAR